MANGQAVFQGDMPGEGSIIEFGGRKFYNCATTANEYSSSDSSGLSSGSEESATERREIMRKRMIGKQQTKAQRSASSSDSGNSSSGSSERKRRRTPNSKEITDAFAFLDCGKKGSSDDTSTSDGDDGEQETAAMEHIFNKPQPPSMQKPSSSQALDSLTPKERKKRRRNQGRPQPTVQGDSGIVEIMGVPEEEVETELPAHRVVRGKIRDETWEDENDVDEDALQRAGYFKPTISPFRRTIEAMLRPDEDPHDPRCWGCDHQEEGDYAVVEKQWNTLMNLFEKRLHKMHPAHLGVFMYRFFAERTAVKMTQAGQMDVKAHLVNKGKDNKGRIIYQFDYSVWSAYSMFRHFTEHHLNPKTHITMDLWRLTFAKIQLEADGFYRKHKDTHRVVIDREAVHTYKILNQQIYQLYRMKPEQMLFFNPNSAIDTQGYAYINSDRPIIHSHGGSDIFRMNYDTTH